MTSNVCSLAAAASGSHAHVYRPNERVPAAVPSVRQSVSWSVLSAGRARKTYAGPARPTPANDVCSIPVAIARVPSGVPSVRWSTSSRSVKYAVSPSDASSCGSSWARSFAVPAVAPSVVHSAPSSVVENTTRSPTRAASFGAAPTGASGPISSCA